MHRGQQGKPKWTGRDRLVILAWEKYLASLCDGCGQQRSRSMNPDMDTWYEVKGITCLACAALDSWHEKSSKGPHGMKPYVLDLRPASDPVRPWIPDLTPDDD